jgi:hypothetical protein
MVDPLRDEDSGAASRESRIEEMLLAGLDQYFSGQHELAISVWTRVLFLDRNHARARAYIERARGAIAERQREGEELLQTGAAAFHRGDANAARTLLTSAVERGVPSEEAQALLDRLDRLAPGLDYDPAERTEPRAARPRATPVPPSDVRVRRGRWFAPIAGAALVIIALAGVGLFVLGPSGLLGSEPASPAAAPVRPPQDPVPVPTAAEASLARARTLHAKGRLRDALAALDAVRAGDALRSEADDLRTTIQRELLATARLAPPAPIPSTPR